MTASEEIEQLRDQLDLITAQSMLRAQKLGREVITLRAECKSWKILAHKANERADRLSSELEEGSAIIQRIKKAYEDLFDSIDPPE